MVVFIVIYILLLIIKNYLGGPPTCEQARLARLQITGRIDARQHWPRLIIIF